MGVKKLMCNLCVSICDSCCFAKSGFFFYLSRCRNLKVHNINQDPIFLSCEVPDHLQLKSLFLPFIFTFFIYCQNVLAVIDSNQRIHDLIIA